MVSGYVESGSLKAAKFRCLVFVNSAILWKELSSMKWDGFLVHNKSLIISSECDLCCEIYWFYYSQMCCLDYLRN